MIAGSARLCKLLAAALLFGAALSGCSIGGLDLDSLRTIPGQPRPAPQMAQPGSGSQTGMAMPASNAEIIGRGPVKVALLLPLSGDPAIANAGRAMANGARLAMSFVEANPKIAENISISLRDTGTMPDGAARQAQAAVFEGASLILGPLLGDQTGAAAQIARHAGVPMIAFSNNGAAAGPGVYLLSVLPEVEVRRSLAYARAQGKRRIAGLFPANAYGSVQKAAFEQGIVELGLTLGPSLTFGSDAELRTAVQRLAQNRGGADALFVPDRESAGRVVAALAAAGAKPGLLIGSSQWDGAGEILGNPALAGAVFPAVDDAGLRAIAPEYAARFGGQPHPLTTLAYTAVILVNNSHLSMSTPKFDRAVLTSQSGFTGRDGVFRFLADGRSQYALVIRRVGAGGAAVVDGARL